jgi:hypothetical protein
MLLSVSPATVDTFKTNKQTNKNNKKTRRIIVQEDLGKK